MRVFDFLRVASELNRILKTRFSGRYGGKTAIGRTLASILYYQNAGDRLQWDIQLNRMSMLVKHLQEVEKYDDSLLRDFRKRIKGCNDDNGFFAIRFELNICASLIRKNIPFEKRESPDFTIQREENVTIECTSAHLSQIKAKDLKYKIRSAINGKSREPYCCSSLALFIDITNVLYTGIKGKSPIVHEELKAYTLKRLNMTELGSVLLFSYIFNSENGRFESGYIRIDNMNINDTLNGFLDECFPKGEYNVYDFSVPAEG